MIRTKELIRAHQEQTRLEEEALLKAEISKVIQSGKEASKQKPPIAEKKVSDTKKLKESKEGDSKSNTKLKISNKMKIKDDDNNSDTTSSDITERLSILLTYK